MGVSGDSRISADTVRFSGWTFWASDSEHRVASYTSLAQIGVDTAALSETDFFNNIKMIIEKMPAYSDLSFYCNVGANFTKSLNLQLIHDGISGAIENMEGLLMIKRRGVANWGVELMYQRNGGDLMVRGLYDVGGSSAVLYPFKVEATFLSTINITPLNGWAFTDFKLGKVGNCAVFTFTTKKSENIKTNGTVIAKFPEEYRPKIGIAFSAIANTSKHNARFVVRPSGEVAVYDVDDSVYVIDCSGVFFTD